MPAATTESTASRLLDNLVERQSTIFDLIRSNNDRSYRFTRSVIEATRQGTRDWTEVGKRILTGPTDFVGIYEAASEAIADGQARSLALTREWIEDTVESQREGRELLRQSLGDARETIQRAQTGAREIAERVQSGTRQIADRVQAAAPAALRRNSRSGNGSKS